MTTIHSDAAALDAIADIARAAGARLLAAYDTQARPADRAQLFSAVQDNEARSQDGLREALQALRPQARWLEEDLEKEALPAGEWWVVDAVEGNINHIHGQPDWGVSIALVRDGVPVLAAFHQPVGDFLYTAQRGQGARLNGQLLRASDKQALENAIVATGQAEPGQRETHASIARSVAAMLDAALLVRTTVPSTFPMLLVAAGQNDVFWQYQPVLPGIAAGVLFVEEAGGTVSRIDGSPWQAGAPDVLVSAPALHGQASRVLAAA